MFRKISPSDGYCLFFPNRRPGKRFVAGRSVWVGPFEEWKHIKLGLFEVQFPIGPQPMPVITSEGLPCDLKASFKIVIGHKEDGREERLEKVTISCPPNRSMADKDRREHVPFFRDWAANFCRKAVNVTYRACQFVRLFEESEYRAQAEKDIENMAREELATVGMVLVECTVIVEPQEPRGILATPEILARWRVYKKDVNEAELEKLKNDQEYEQDRKRQDAEHGQRTSEIAEEEKRKLEESKQRTKVHFAELALKLKQEEAGLAIKEQQEMNRKDEQIGLIKEEMNERAHRDQLNRISREDAQKKQGEQNERERDETRRAEEQKQIAHRQTIAEKEVALLALQAKLDVAKVELERQKGQVDADNLERAVLAKGAHDRRMQELLVKVLPEIAEQVARPVEKIGEIRVLNLAGAASADVGGSNGIGSLIASASTLPLIRELFGFLHELSDPFQRGSAEPNRRETENEGRAADGVAR